MGRKGVKMGIGFGIGIGFGVGEEEDVWNCWRR